MRLIALFIDLLLMFFVLIVVKLLLGQVFEFELSRTLLDPAGHTFDRLTNRYDLILLALALLLPLTYAVLTEMTARAATLGKRMLGLTVVSSTGRRAGPVRAIARNLAKVLSAVPLMLGFMIAALPGKRALHDLLTGSRVVRRRRR